MKRPALTLQIISIHLRGHNLITKGPRLQSKIEVTHAFKALTYIPRPNNRRKDFEVLRQQRKVPSSSSSALSSSSGSSKRKRRSDDEKTPIRSPNKYRPRRRRHGANRITSYVTSITNPRGEQQDEPSSSSTQSSHDPISSAQVTEDLPSRVTRSQGQAPAQMPLPPKRKIFQPKSTPARKEVILHPSRIPGQEPRFRKIKNYPQRSRSPAPSEGDSVSSPRSQSESSEAEASSFPSQRGLVLLPAMTTADSSPVPSVVQTSDVNCRSGMLDKGKIFNKRVNTRLAPQTLQKKPSLTTCLSSPSSDGNPDETIEESTTSL